MERELQRDQAPAVLVAGAGIAGMAAAMHLGHLGHRVVLLDTAPAIGGSMHLLDHTFPTNSCGLCLMLPEQPALCPTLECERSAAVRLVPWAELVGVGGEAGAFRARVRHKPRYVDLARCNGCGACAAVCPEARPHDHEGWLAPVRAIYRPAGLRAVPDGYVIDMAYCTRCGACVEACPAGAIDLNMEGGEEELAVGAVLLAPGYAAFDARRKGEYGYGVYDNVLTALEFERMVSLAGSGVARLVRPSDRRAGSGAGGRAPRRVAFVQCVGSRDVRSGAGHCSSVCCMYTAKQVALAKRLDPELAATVFYMDLRGVGKGYEAYLAGVQGMPGVRYVRAMPSSLHQEQQSRDLRVTYVAEDGRLREETFDLVVLAVGLAAPGGMAELAGRLGVALNSYGFAAGDGYQAAGTGREGIFVTGAFREPKDIPETVVEAAAAAAEVAAFLREAEPGNGGEARPAARPLAAVREVGDEAPRTGVFVCRCNGELAGLDPAALLAWVRGLPGVACARAVEDGCSAEGRAGVQAVIEAEGLNRVVVAGCSLRVQGDEWDGVMRGAGLDPRLLARVNLREQVVYPHRDNGHDLAGKARALVGMAVGGLQAMTGVAVLGQGNRRALVRRALVVGGGAAGMSAALALAGLGVPVDLVEREAELGGQWRQLRYQPDGSDPQAVLAEWVGRVAAEGDIRVHLRAEVKASSGQPGAYRSLIGVDGRDEEVEHGVVIVATGGQAAATGEYLYGQHPAVISQRELEERLAAASSSLPGVPGPVVMIQCAGSREPGRPYCSRVCCTQAVKNALKLKEVQPETAVYILYREIRTYGFREAYYQAARAAGVVFVRYELPGLAGQGAGKPQVAAQGERVRVRVVEPVTGQPLELDAGLLVLSTGIVPSDALGTGPSGGRALADTLGLALDGDGFFQEEHAKMKPLDLGKGGLYVAGLAHSPRFLDETIVQGKGAALRAAAFLAPGVVAGRPTAVWVNPRLCSFCGLCVETCPYGARVMDEETRVAQVDEPLCQGCGVCAMVCPNKATLQKAFEHKQLMAAVDMALVS